MKASIRLPSFNALRALRAAAKTWSGTLPQLFHTPKDLQSWGVRVGLPYMNTKIVIGVIVALVVIGGLFFIMKGTAGAPAQPGATGSAASTTPQVQGQDITVGTGAVATPGSVVSVLYVGYVGTVSTSTIFDSSAAHGNKPLPFTLGEQGLIPGFQIGVNGMKVGGERMIAIPPELGYGATAVHQDPNNPSSPVIIPPNSTLIFDVKVVDVKPGTTTPATAPTQ